MTEESLKRIISGLLLALLISVSCVTILLYDGTTGSKHLGGIINISMAVGFVHLVDLLDQRWSLYVQIIEKQNMALGLAYAGWIIGATIAFPSSIM